MTTFRTVLEPTGGNNVGIVVPEDIVLSFDRGKRVPVVVTIDGDYRYKTTIGVMGGSGSGAEPDRATALAGSGPCPEQPPVAGGPPPSARCRQDPPQEGLI